MAKSSSNSRSLSGHSNVKQHNADHLPMLSTPPICGEKTVLDEVWECIQSQQLINHCTEKDAIMDQYYHPNLNPKTPPLILPPPSSIHQLKQKHDGANTDSLSKKELERKDWKYYMRMKIAPKTIDRLGGLLFFFEHHICIYNILFD
ncbi:hypothetical protein RFI_31856 [Reticulomyxa filosa]|uniref:Uncharacterized protein n=1 Tax=Reticulomyxa filosa TaxID=46433 RepID=X6LXS8_RETFI|nr:hypothetical protein RFI_31856 [Reticulomyxa filosa]|eukprot:ETO05540.1 hypothetical protein RFI_31856 [Reticulomyxa filosa]